MILCLKRCKNKKKKAIIPNNPTGFWNNELFYKLLTINIIQKIFIACP